MQGLQIDSQNNLIVKNGSFIIIKDEYKTAQDVKTQLGLFKGENPFNVDEGIAWLDTKLSPAQLNFTLRERIKQNQEVVSIESLEINQTDKELEIDIKMNSIYGVVNV